MSPPNYGVAGKRYNAVAILHQYTEDIMISQKKTSPTSQDDHWSTRHLL